MNNDWYDSETRKRVEEAKLRQHELNQCATEAMPEQAGVCHTGSIRQELEHRKYKLLEELRLVESAIESYTPEVEEAVNFMETLARLGMRRR